MARSNYDAAVLTTVVGWFYREGYRQQRPVDFGDNDKRICEVAEAVQVAREKLREADARWTDLPREDLDNFMDGVVDDEDRESMTLVVCPLNKLTLDPRDASTVRARIGRSTTRSATCGHP